MPAFVTRSASSEEHPASRYLAIVTLATGIGATCVMFALVHAVLLRALPFTEPERLVWMYNLRTERDRAPLSLPDLEDYRRETSTLADLAVFTNWTTNLTGAGDAERLDGVRVSGNFFELLGSQPVLGRLLQPKDERGDARGPCSPTDYGCGGSVVTGRSSARTYRSTALLTPLLASCHNAFSFHFARPSWRFPSRFEAIRVETIEARTFCASSRGWRQERC